MKKVLISIKPEMVAKILNGEKHIELRKTYPKNNIPCDVYIYCTKNGGKLIKENGKYKIVKKSENSLNGKIVAKFKLDAVIIEDFNNKEQKHYNIELKTTSVLSQLSEEDVLKYANGKKLYCWSIRDLEIFSKKLTLYSFSFEKAPQSWCYIKETA